MTVTRASSPNEPASVGYRFRDALTVDGISIIAEIKRRSPSRGEMRTDAQAATFARAYEAGGAACLSVLTDADRFGGSPEDLREASSAVDIPVLRKDFLTTRQDVHESHEMGADAMLLIVPDVSVEMIRPLHELALSLGMDVLAEVRSEAELETAVEHGAYMIAINQRDDPKSQQFTVDYGKAVEMSRMFDQFDAGIVKVAASGIGVPGGTPLAAVEDAGYDAALIGEALVTAPDPTAALHQLRHNKPVPIG